MQNNWGPYFPQSTYEYPSDGGVPTPPATPPQSPSGSVTGESATDNFNLGQTSTQIALEQNSIPAGLVAGSTGATTSTLTSPVQIQGCRSVAQNCFQSSCEEKVIS
jgi:hypothetical protein